MGKFGKKKAESGFGIRFGKNGKRMKAAMKALKPAGSRPTTTTNFNMHRDNPKKAKRRALRAVVVPEALKTGRRANKKLLLAVHLMGAEAAQEAAAEVTEGMANGMDTA